MFIEYAERKIKLMWGHFDVEWELKVWYNKKAVVDEPLASVWCTINRIYYKSEYGIVVITNNNGNVIDTMPTEKFIKTFIGYECEQIFAHRAINIYHNYPVTIEKDGRLKPNSKLWKRRAAANANN